MAAAYMLRLTQKLAWGEPSSVKGWKDLNMREWVYLLPLAVFVIYIGLAPKIFFDTIDPSLERLLGELQSKTMVEIDSSPILSELAQAGDEKLLEAQLEVHKWHIEDE